LFSPKQWVNVYVNQLEPTNEHGEIMTVAEAKRCSQ
jgi:hypothetical protein